MYGALLYLLLLFFLFLLQDFFSPSRKKKLFGGEVRSPVPKYATHRTHGAPSLHCRAIIQPVYSRIAR